jgi:chromosome segregation ATPase
VYLPVRAIAAQEAEVTTKKGIMGFLSNVGLVEEVPDAPVQTQRIAPVPSHAEHFSSAPGNPDPEVLAKLEKRLQDHCPSAYTSFMEQYETLKEVIPDEATRFKGALKTSHTTTEQLIGAIDQLVGAMDAAKAEFSHTFEDNKSRRLGEAEASLKATDDLIASNEKQLQSLQETIASLRTKRDTDAQSLEHEGQRLDSIRASFDAAHSQVVGRLQAQKNRVQTMPKV